MKKTIAIAALALAVSGLSFGLVSAKGSKMDICHMTGNGKGHVINVSTSAAQAHYDHGDPRDFTNNGDGTCSAGSQNE